MKPKEKAQELIKKFSFNTRCFSETKGWEDSFFDAKECALIAVDEILSLNVFEYTSDWSNTIEYWQEVKQEINKL
jgi:hypothetical protein